MRLLKDYKITIEMKNSFIYILLLVSLLFPSCEQEFFSDCVEGNDAIETLLVDVDEVTEIVVGFAAKITIDEGETQKIELIGPKAIIDKIAADSRYSNKEYNMKLNGCSSFDEVEINVVIQKLEGLSVSGSSDVKFLGKFNNVDDVKFETSGKSNMDIDLGMAVDVEISISGTSDIKIIGESQKFKTEISGTGDLKAFDFQTEECIIDISGSGSAEVNVVNSLKVDISGSADVCYKGTPALTLNLSGSGSVENCN